MITITLVGHDGTKFNTYTNTNTTKVRGGFDKIMSEVLDFIKKNSTYALWKDEDGEVSLLKGSTKFTKDLDYVLDPSDVHIRDLIDLFNLIAYILAEFDYTDDDEIDSANEKISEVLTLPYCTVFRRIFCEKSFREYWQFRIDNIDNDIDWEPVTTYNDDFGNVINYFCGGYETCITCALGYYGTDYQTDDMEGCLLNVMNIVNNKDNPLTRYTKLKLMELVRDHPLDEVQIKKYNILVI